jgi:hypothetical protein
MTIEYSATISVIEEKNWRKTKNLTGLSDSRSPDGSPIESKNEFKQKRAG